jgi:subtilisin family serine protease
MGKLITIISIMLNLNAICITNFDRELCGEFRVLNSIIIKSKLNEIEIEKRFKRDFKKIATLKSSFIYLIDSNDSVNESKELTKNDFIIYAQPNISQIKEKSFQSSQNITQKYNLEKIWTTTKGEGINIAIIDDGFNLKHEDLKGVNVIFSYDVDNKNIDSSEKLDIDTHGTQVVGVIFAQHNNIGIDGISPKANLIAIRQTTNITSDTIFSFTIAQKTKADIINCSWNSPILLEPIYDVIQHLSKNIIIVFSAGNNHKKIKPFSTEASIDGVVTVGATQYYSNYGDILDFRITSGVISTKSDGTYGKFGGTSATAPIITGLLALKLSQNREKSIQELVQNLKKELNENFKR